jgi:hypothetical protein
VHSIEASHAICHNHLKRLIIEIDSIFILIGTRERTTSKLFESSSLPENPAEKKSWQIILSFQQMQEYIFLLQRVNFFLQMIAKKSL